MIQGLPQPAPDQELVQQDFTAEKVVARIQEILPEGPTRERMIQGLRRIQGRLRAPRPTSGAAQHPADRAAEIILPMMREGVRGA